jgi:hypothetical protein
MCDETIVLNASAGNWKQTVTSAVQKIEIGSSDASKMIEQTQHHVSVNRTMSMAFKKERCRQCVIYNMHQEQKYKALVFCAFAGLAAALYFYSGDLLSYVSIGYHGIDHLMANLSFSTQAAPAATTVKHLAGSPVQAAQPALGAGEDLSVPVSWAVLIIASMIGLSYVLQLIEYACFKVKI